ncbi:MAG: LysR family transcriptional regulator [Eubacteriaceae bacterium]|jgi:DNA-binding transcriptional LysR family regulator|nr:LysR family transcriptional regulator [Eubacteriaceae bacterium]
MSAITTSDKSINWESYRVFYYTAKNLNITGAARELYISQPAVSKTISVLESELGCRLFFRKSKGVLLTPEGAELYDHVKRAFEEIAEGEQTLRSRIFMEHGEITIAASDTALRYFLLDAISDFRILYQDIAITVHTYPSDNAIESLRSGESDMAVIVTPLISIGDLDMRAIKDIEYIFIAGKDYPVPGGGRPVHLKQIANEDIICMGKGMATRRNLDSFFENCGLMLNPKYALPENELILDFTKRNLGIGIMTAVAAENAIREGSIVQVPVIEKIPTIAITIVTLKKNLSMQAERFIESVL